MVNPLTGFPMVREGHLRVAPLLGLRGVLAARGLSLQALLRQARLPAGLLDDPENTAAFADLGRLLSLAARRTDCDHVALAIGKPIGLQTLGPIGPLARAAPTVGAALRGVIVALHLHDRATVPTLLRVDGRAQLSTVPLASIDEGAAHVADLTMVACFNIVRDLCGPGWQAAGVRLARRRPGDPRPYVRAFGMTPHFDAERNALQFDAAWLARPVASGTSAMEKAALDALVSLHPLDPPALVRRACIRAIIEGQATVSRVARLSGLSRRTLNRRLAAFGTTAQAELLEVKQAVAKQLLDGTGLSLTEIAQLLGYTDSSAFTRAFRSTEGTAPSRWRARRGPVL